MPEKNPHILIVDDEEEILHALKRVLSRENYLITIENNPLEAERIVSEENIDVIISDIMMEKMSGLDLIEKIKTGHPHIPIILITGNPSLNSAQEALRHQAFDYIPKPVERFKILEVTRRAIQHKKESELSAREKEENKTKAEFLSRRNQDLNLQNTIILDATKDFVITITDDGTIFSLNKSAKLKFENPDFPLVGKNISSLFPPEKQEAYSRLLKTAIRFKKSSSSHIIEVDLLDSHSKRINCEISFCHYTIDDSIFYTGIFRDNSEKKILTQRLIESEKRALLNTIAASIGHEINNALTAIMGFMEVAVQPDSTNQTKERAIQVTMSQTEKLRNLTSNLLTLGKSKEFWIESSESTTDINSVLESVIEVFDKSKRIKNCNLNIEKHPQPLYVNGSRDKLELAISNLILNAADATNNHGEIQIKTYIEGGEPALMIRDNGVGMTREVQKKIFEPYFSTKEIGKGTGLGMFVVKEIASLYGIKILIESKPNEGSIFLLRFSHAK